MRWLCIENVLYYRVDARDCCAESASSSHLDFKPDFDLTSSLATRSSSVTHYSTHAVSSGRSGQLRPADRGPHSQQMVRTKTLRRLTSLYHVAQPLFPAPDAIHPPHPISTHAASGHLFFQVLFIIHQICSGGATADETTR